MVDERPRATEMADGARLIVIATNSLRPRKLSASYEVLRAGKLNVAVKLLIYAPPGPTSVVISVALKAPVA